MDLAVAEKDYATQQFLSWFVTEQVEEEANASDICAQIRMTEGAPGQLFAVNRELGMRE